MNKKNIVLKIVIALLSILIVGLTIYKLLNNNNNNEKNNKINSVGNLVQYTHDIQYIDAYKDNVINDIITNVEYNITSGNDVLYGEYFIADNSKLYITNKINNNKYLALDKNVKTIYSNKEGINSSSIYVITEDKKLYYINLTEPNINSLIVKEILTPSPVLNFTNLKINSFIGDTLSVVVLCEDNKMYYSNPIIEYNDNIIEIMDKYIVYPDGVITNINGNVLINENNSFYVAKNIIYANEPIKELEYNPNLIIITEDDKLIYLIDSDKTFEYSLSVEYVALDDDNNIKIIFEDNSELVFEGYYNQKYYPILFEKE